MAKSVWRTARDGQPVKLSVSPPSDVNDPSMFRVEGERERDVFSRNGFLTAMENVIPSWKGKTKQGFEVLEDEGETSCLFISSRLDIT